MGSVVTTANLKPNIPRIQRKSNSVHRGNIGEKLPSRQAKNCLTTAEDDDGRGSQKAIKALRAIVNSTAEEVISDSEDLHPTEEGRVCKTTMLDKKI